jgi:hypothetical protein
MGVFVMILPYFIAQRETDGLPVQVTDMLETYCLSILLLRCYNTVAVVNMERCTVILAIKSCDEARLGLVAAGRVRAQSSGTARSAKIRALTTTVYECLRQRNDRHFVR